jgi:hypothetical protein
MVPSLAFAFRSIDSTGGAPPIWFFGRAVLSRRKANKPMQISAIGLDENAEPQDCRATIGRLPCRAVSAMSAHDAY